MNFINDLKPTNDPFSYWGNAVKDTVRQNAVYPNSDFVSDSNFGGTFLELSSKYKYLQNPDTYTGEWDITGSYSVGDVVRVMPGKDYIWGDLKNAANSRSPGVTMATNPSPVTSVVAGSYAIGQLLLIGNYATATNNIVMLYVKPIPGVYRCCSTIPSMFEVYDTIQNGGFTTNINSNLFAGLTYFLPPPIVPPTVIPFVGDSVRFFDVNYFPVWPELPNQAASNGKDFKGFNGRYWELLSLLPLTQTVRTCLNGVSSITTTMIDSAQRPTGSYMNATGSFPNVP
jgi:hypothetical protein